jgi:tRNA threonylcarbamoyladenosine biosynthesis protein TsaB
LRQQPRIFANFQGSAFLEQSEVMLLLAIDTSGKQGSIAIAECGPNNACEVIEVTALSGGTFSAELVPQIASLLESHSFSKADIGCFAVVSGPGSFTGLRIGLAVVKALADVLVKPIAEVSMLEAVASAADSQGRVIAALDGGRNEVFLGEYEVSGSGVRLVRERLLTRAEWLGSAHEAIVVTPELALAEAAQAKGLPVRKLDRPRSDAIARLGWKKIAAGEIVSAEALEANYVGRSEAELFVKSG